MLEFFLRRVARVCFSFGSFLGFGGVSVVVVVSSPFFRRDRTEARRLSGLPSMAGPSSLVTSIGESVDMIKIGKL